MVKLAMSAPGLERSFLLLLSLAGPWALQDMAIPAWPGPPGAPASAFEERLSLPQSCRQRLPAPRPCTGLLPDAWHPSPPPLPISQG